MTPHDKALSLPLKPGVYIMKDAEGTVIYVGKAKALKNRVSSYFHGAHNAKTEAMIAKIADFSFIVASSEFEALVLENSLIKRYMPRYNILLKDDKGYPFVRLDVKSEYPTFSITAERRNDGAMYFGPFGGRNVTRTAVEAVCKALKLPTCSRVFPRDIGKERPCLNHHMGVCDAYCLPGTDPAKYRDGIDKAVMVMQGRTEELVAALRGEMEQAAEALRFEDAARIRDTMNAVAALSTKQHVWAKASADTDAAAFFRGQVKSCFVVLHYINGRLLAKDSQIVDTPVEEDGEALSALLRGYYEGAGAVPKTVYLPVDTGDTEELSRYLGEQAGHAVSVTAPKSGRGKIFAAAAAENAQEDAEIATTAEERVTKTALWLADALQLPAPPERIEAFDISNLGSENIVASMVVFKNGKPLKSAYRRFAIKSTDGQDDYASMYETILRRFARYQGGDEKFGELPDLLLIDGGAGQVRAALDALREVDVSVPAYGMVKDDRHRTRAIASAEGEEIGLEAFPGAFSFVGRIQEEAHRFAITYHRELRSRGVKKSALDGVDGVGEKRKTALLKKFRSVKAVAAATEEELAAVVPKNTAKAVWEHFHGQSGE